LSWLFINNYILNIVFISLAWELVNVLAPILKAKFVLNRCPTWRDMSTTKWKKNDYFVRRGQLVQERWCWILYGRLLFVHCRSNYRVDDLHGPEGTMRYLIWHFDRIPCDILKNALLHILTYYINVHRPLRST
jgi:hypothetical protein